MRTRLIFLYDFTFNKFRVRFQQKKKKLLFEFIFDKNSDVKKSAYLHENFVLQYIAICIKLTN